MNNSDRIGAGPDTKDLPRKGIFFVELRTHGVSGTPPEGILDADAKVVPFVGDKLANFWHRKRHSDAERYQRAGLTEWQACDGDPTGDAPAVIIEGYRWGNLTAGSVKKAMWAFLFPFALTNLAAWMVPPVRQDADMSAWRPKLLGFVRSDNDQASRQKAGMSERQLRFVRHLRRFRLLKTVQLVRRLKNKDAGTRSGAPAGIIRMFGVLLTGLFVMQAVVILADLMAAQCISRNTDVCLNVPARLSWVRSTINHFAGHPLTLALIIGILVGVLVSLCDTADRRARAPARGRRSTRTGCCRHTDRRPRTSGSSHNHFAEARVGRELIRRRRRPTGPRTPLAARTGGVRGADPVAVRR